jgi:hypothetical protein
VNFAEGVNLILKNNLEEFESQLSWASNKENNISIIVFYLERYNLIRLINPRLLISLDEQSENKINIQCMLLNYKWQFDVPIFTTPRLVD